MAYLKAGSTVRFQANVNVAQAPSIFGTIRWADIENAIRAAAAGKGATITQYVGPQEDWLGNAPTEGNLQVNLTSNIDRGDIGDLKGDLDAAIQSRGAILRASAVQLTSPGGTVPGTIPNPIQGDTYHAPDTAIGTTAQFWLDQLGQQVRGLGTALSQGSPMMWLGVGVVVLLLLNRK